MSAQMIPIIIVVAMLIAYALDEERQMYEADRRALEDEDDDFWGYGGES